MDSYSTLQVCMKFAYIVTGLVFLLSYWISDNVTVLHKCGHANRGTEIICIAFVASIFCYSKRSSTILLQCVKGNLAYRNFGFFLPTWKTFAYKLWNDSSIDLCFNFLYLFWAYQLAVLDSFTFYSMRNGSMNSYPIFTNLKKNKK